MDEVTVALGNSLRNFQEKTCSAYDTRELGREADARKKCQTKAAATRAAEAQKDVVASGNDVPATGQAEESGEMGKGTTQMAGDPPIVGPSRANEKVNSNQPNHIDVVQHVLAGTSRETGQGPAQTPTGFIPIVGQMGEDPAAVGPGHLDHVEGTASNTLPSKKRKHTKDHVVGIAGSTRSSGKEVAQTTDNALVTMPAGVSGEGDVHPEDTASKPPPSKKRKHAAKKKSPS